MNEVLTIQNKPFNKVENKVIIAASDFVQKNNLGIGDWIELQPYANEAVK